MTDEERINAFLASFKEVEKEIIALSKLEGDFVSFSRALNEVYYQRLNPTVADRDVYDFLKTASDLRNLLSHENDVCAPTEDFLVRFDQIKERILHPLTCYQAATKGINYLRPGDSLKTAELLLVNNGLSHLPILDSDGIVTGVFSRSTLFDYVSLHGEVSLDASYSISDFREVTGLNDHQNEFFLFVSRTESVRDAFEALNRKEMHTKKAALLFVTEHGKPEERLLGVISAGDLIRSIAENP